MLSNDSYEYSIERYVRSIGIDKRSIDRNMSSFEIDMRSIESYMSSIGINKRSMGRNMEELKSDYQDTKVAI